MIPCNKEGGFYWRWEAEDGIIRRSYDVILHWFTRRMFDHKAHSETHKAVPANSKASFYDLRKKNMAIRISWALQRKKGADFYSVLQVYIYTKGQLGDSGGGELVVSQQGEGEACGERETQPTVRTTLEVGLGSFTTFLSSAGALCYAFCSHTEGPRAPLWHSSLLPLLFFSTAYLSSPPFFFYLCGGGKGVKSTSEQTIAEEFHFPPLNWYLDSRFMDLEKTRMMVDSIKMKIISLCPQPCCRYYLFLARQRSLNTSCTCAG